MLLGARVPVSQWYTAGKIPADGTFQRVTKRRGYNKEGTSLVAGPVESKTGDKENYDLMRLRKRPTPTNAVPIRKSVAGSGVAESDVSVYV